MLSPQCNELSLCDVEDSLDKSVKLDNKHVSQPHKATVDGERKIYMVFVYQRGKWFKSYLYYHTV